jgi:flagellar assembly factor FliW
MKINTTRFGQIEVPESTLITLEAGMIGFPRDTVYAWIPHRSSLDIAWLQSVQTPGVAFPLLNAVRVGNDYPEMPVSGIADQGGVVYADETDLGLLVVLSAPPGEAPTLNLIAPVVINSVTRMGAQVVLQGSRFHVARVERKVPSAFRTVTP